MLEYEIGKLDFDVELEARLNDVLIYLSELCATRHEDGERYTDGGEFLSLVTFACNRLMVNASEVSETDTRSKEDLYDSMRECLDEYSFNMGAETNEVTVQ